MLKIEIVLILTGLVLCGCSRVSSEPRTTRHTEGIKGQLIGREELVDAGNTTPEAAWESRYWARARGDYDAVIAATVPEMVETAKGWMGDKAEFREKSKKEFDGFKGIQILARKDLATNRVELKYEFAFGFREETKIVEMVKIDGAWRSGATRGWEESWDEGSVAEAGSEAGRIRL